MTTAQLDNAIRQKQKQVDQITADLAYAQEQLDDWKRAEVQDAANAAAGTGGSPETQAHTARQVKHWTDEVKRLGRELEREVTELERLTALPQAIEDAALAAIRAGITPEAAYAEAEAKVMAAETRRKLLRGIGWGLLALAVLALGWYAMKNMRRR